MHGDHPACLQIEEGLDRFLGVHVDLASAGRVVGADGHQSDVDLESVADFLEAIKVRGIAAMEDGAPAGLDNEAAEAAMGIVQHAGAPMMAWGEGDPDRAMLKALPVMQFMNAAEAEVVDEIAHLERDDDGLILGNVTESLAIEVIEMSVGDQDEVDLRQVVQLDAGMLDALDDLEPLGPSWDR